MFEERQKTLPYYYEDFNEEVKSNIQAKLELWMGGINYDPESAVKFFNDVDSTTHPDSVATIIEYIEEILALDFEDHQSEWHVSYSLMKLRALGDPEDRWASYPKDGFEVGAKILGLDIDGVLNTFRGSMTSGWGGICLSQILRDPDAMDKFDQFGLNFLRQLCKKSDTQILLITQQRIGLRDNELKALSMFLDLPIVGKTRSFGARKDEILEWLNNHPQVQQYASVDDEYYYVDIHKASPRIPSELETKSTHVRIDQHNGILYHDMEKLATFFGIDLRDTFKRQEK